MAYGMYPPAYGPLAEERTQQVDELLRQFPGCRPVNADRSVFDLLVELPDKKATTLRITLPAHFPQERPSLSVLFPVINRCVDPGGRLHTSLLSSWVYGSSRLSSAVAEAVAALNETAPGTSAAAAGADSSTVPFPVGYPVPPGPLHSRPPVAGGSGSKSPSPHRMQQGPMGGPATTNSLPDFSRYTAEHCEELLKDESAFKALLQEAIKGSPMAATLEEIRVKNRQLAESNLNKQAAINEVRNQLAIVRSSEYTLIKSRFDELLSRQQKVLSTMGSVVWREKLEEAVSAADATSSALVSDFMSGDVPLDQFVQKHVDMRVDHHVLDLKRQAAETLLAGSGTSGGGAAAGRSSG